MSDMYGNKTDDLLERARAEHEIRKLDIDPEKVIEQLQKENEKLRSDNFSWQHKWEQSEAYVKDHWIIRVPKLKPDRGITRAVTTLLSMNMNKLTRLYIIVCILAVGATSLAEIAVRLKELRQ